MQPIVEALIISFRAAGAARQSSLSYNGDDGQPAEVLEEMRRLQGDYDYG